jgi:hypothetical protein
MSLVFAASISLILDIVLKTDLSDNAGENEHEIHYP